MGAIHVEMVELALTQSTTTVALVTMDTRAPTVRQVGIIRIVATKILLVFKYSRVYVMFQTHVSHDAVFLEMLQCLLSDLITNVLNIVLTILL